jgi:multidrug efflux system membrane fusion protein
VLDFMDNRMDKSTGTLRVRGVFENPAPGHLLQAGFFTRIRVPARAKYNALLIPDKAIGTDQAQKFVLTVNEQDMVEYRPVKLGPVIEGLRVLRDGVKASDWVIVNGLMAARPGAKVKPERVADGATTNAVSLK